jgi:hypothetical protein
MNNDPLNRQDLRELADQVAAKIEMLLESLGIIKANGCPEGYKTKDVRRFWGARSINWFPYELRGRSVGRRLGELSITIRKMSGDFWKKDFDYTA